MKIKNNKIKNKNKSNFISLVNKIMIKDKKFKVRKITTYKKIIKN